MTVYCRSGSAFCQMSQEAFRLLAVPQEWSDPRVARMLHVDLVLTVPRFQFRPEEIVVAGRDVCSLRDLGASGLVWAEEESRSGALVVQMIDGEVAAVVLVKTVAHPIHMSVNAVAGVATRALIPETLIARAEGRDLLYRLRTMQQGNTVHGAITPMPLRLEGPPANANAQGRRIPVSRGGFVVVDNVAMVDGTLVVHDKYGELLLFPEYVEMIQ